MYINPKTTAALLFLAGYLFDFSSAVEKRSKGNGQYVAIRPRGQRETQLDLGKGLKNYYYLCRDVPRTKFNRNNGDVFAEDEESNMVTLPDGIVPERDSTIGCRWWPKVNPAISQGEDQFYDVSGLPRRERSWTAAWPLEYLGCNTNSRTDLGPYSVISALADNRDNPGSKIAFQRRPGTNSPKERFLERLQGETYIVQTHIEPILLTSGVKTQQPRKLCRNTLYAEGEVTHPWKLYLDELPAYLIKTKSLDCKDVDLWLLPITLKNLGNSWRKLTYSVANSDSLKPKPVVVDRMGSRFWFELGDFTKDARKKEKERLELIKRHDKFKEAMEDEEHEMNKVAEVVNTSEDAKDGGRKFEISGKKDEEEPPLFKSRKTSENGSMKILQDGTGEDGRVGKASQGDRQGGEDLP